MWNFQSGLLRRRFSIFFLLLTLKGFELCLMISFKRLCSCPQSSLSLTLLLQLCFFYLPIALFILLGHILNSNHALPVKVRICDLSLQDSSAVASTLQRGYKMIIISVSSDCSFEVGNPDTSCCWYQHLEWFILNFQRTK